MNGKISTKNSLTRKITDLESNISNASQRKKPFKGLDKRCSIEIHSRRKRLTDADGICGKYLIDSIAEG